MTARAFLSLAIAGFLIAAMPVVVQAGRELNFRDGFEAFPILTIESPPVQVAAGTSGTTCYYLRMPNTSKAAVRRWSATKSDAVHHFVLYTTHAPDWTPLERQPAGTVTPVDCGLAAAGNIGWLYAEHQDGVEFVMPDDDGTGQRLAMPLAAGQPVVLQMYLFNGTTAALQGTVAVEAEVLPAGTAYTETASYVGTSRSFTVPNGATAFEVTANCPVPPGAVFWGLSARTHQQGTLLAIRDGMNDLVSGNTWFEPFVLTSSPPFIEFGATGMGYRCVFRNMTGRPIAAGDHPELDEACYGIGFFFPVSRPVMCVNGIGPL